MNAPLVTIVTPSLNQAPFVRATIESVLAQDYPYVEYWVIDGGSTDETISILHSYGKRVKWLSESDRGQAEAINKGWRLGKGEIIAWLNSDDLLAPGAVSQAAKFLEENPSLAGVYGDCLYIDRFDRLVGKYPAGPYDYDRLVMETEDFIPQPTTFLRRSWVERVGMVDESLHYVLDYDLWLRMGLLAPFEYLPIEMGYARLHDGAKTVASAPRFGHELSTIFQRLIQCPAFPPGLKEKQSRILAKAFVHAASYCFWGGETRAALNYLWRAWQQVPFQYSRTFWLLLLFSLPGHLGWKLAEKLHGNPFRLERGLLL